MISSHSLVCCASKGEVARLELTKDEVTQMGSMNVTSLRYDQGGNGFGEDEFERLLKLIDERNDALVFRIQECVNESLHRHLGSTEKRQGKCASKFSKPRATAPSDDKNASPFQTVSTSASGEPAVSSSSSSDGAIHPCNDADRNEQRVGPNPSVGPRAKKPNVKGDVDASADPSAAAETWKGDVAQEGTVDEDQINPGPSPKSFTSDGTCSRQSFNPRNSLLEGVDIGIGHLGIEIVEAKDIFAADFNLLSERTSDPYVKILTEQGEVFRTRVIKKTVNPVWNDSCKFKVAPDDPNILVELWDEDLLKDHDLLGRISLKPSQFVADVVNAGGTLERWFDFTPDDECPQATGQVLLRASFERDKESAGTIAYFRLSKWDANFVDDSKYEDDLEKTPNKLQKIVNHKTFDMVFCGCILFNAIVMLIELEYFGRQSRGDYLMLEEPGAQYSSAFEDMLMGLNYFFCAAFVIELILRLAAFGPPWLKRPANWLDIVIVVGSVVDVAGAAVPVNLTFMRLIRLSKLTRLLKVALMASFCEPLRILIKAISTSFGHLLWSFILLAAIEIISALFMTQVLADAIKDEGLDLELRNFIFTYYGTTSRTILTMFQITMAPGAWAIVGRRIVEEVSEAYAWFFILYVGGVSFAVVKIITALFLRKTIQIATSDEQLIFKEKVKSQRRYSEKIRSQWNTLDAYGTTRVSFSEFRNFVTHTPEGQEWLSVLEIDAKEAASIFELISDGDGLLTLDEFLSGVFRLKDTTRPIDIVVLQNESRKMSKMVGEVFTELHEVSLVCKQLADGVLEEKSAEDRLSGG